MQSKPNATVLDDREDSTKKKKKDAPSVPEPLTTLLYQQTPQPLCLSVSPYAHQHTQKGGECRKTNNRNVPSKEKSRKNAWRSQKKANTLKGNFTPAHLQDPPPFAPSTLSDGYGMRSIYVCSLRFPGEGWQQQRADHMSFVFHKKKYKEES